jgi:diacylglycerol kinase
MKQAASFFSERLRGIGFAFEGIICFLRTETHAIVHTAATMVVIAACFLFPVSFHEIMALVIVTGMVWMTELLNTAIEKTMDFLESNKKPEVKFIKDVAAGAVLVSAVTAVLVACIIFIPKF